MDNNLLLRLCGGTRGQPYAGPENGKSGRQNNVVREPNWRSGQVFWFWCGFKCRSCSMFVLRRFGKRRGRERKEKSRSAGN